jgi:hypothetical protein
MGPDYCYLGSRELTQAIINSYTIRECSSIQAPRLYVLVIICFLGVILSIVNKSIESKVNKVYAKKKLYFIFWFLLESRNLSIFDFKALVFLVLLDARKYFLILLEYLIISLATVSISVQVLNFLSFPIFLQILAIIPGSYWVTFF